MPEDISQQITDLNTKIENASLPQELAERILTRIESLARFKDSPESLNEFEKIANYVKTVAALPWNTRSQDNFNLENAKTILDEHHYGLEEIKTRILEFISILKLNKEKGSEKEIISHAPIFAFVGLVGTGKTTIALSIAQALGRQFARIPFGGMGSPLDLRGQSRWHSEAEPGRIIKALQKTQTKNPVILLDEIDRIAEEGRSSIMGVLVELLDPEQNKAFLDHYIDYPFDLSEVMFIATANNTTNIATAVLDRIEVIQMPSYTDSEKIAIGKNYMLPKILSESGLPQGTVLFADDIWPEIVRPLGYDAGMRTLERTIESVVRKIAMEYVQGKVKNVQVTNQNLKIYLPA